MCIWLRFWVHNILVTIILQTWHQITTTISAELILLGCSYTWLTLLGKFLLVLSPSPRPTRSWLCVRWTQHRHECTLTSQPFSDCSSSYIPGVPPVPLSVERQYQNLYINSPSCVLNSSCGQERSFVQIVCFLGECFSALVSSLYCLLLFLYQQMVTLCSFAVGSERVVTVWHRTSWQLALYINPWGGWKRKKRVFRFPVHLLFWTSESLAVHNSCCYSSDRR